MSSVGSLFSYVNDARSHEPETSTYFLFSTNVRLQGLDNLCKMYFNYYISAKVIFTYSVCVKGIFICYVCVKGIFIYYVCVKGICKWNDKRDNAKFLGYLT